MATGYTVTGRGDLDALFKARTSSAGSNTNFKSNGGVDLAQRFEPRGSTTAIAATGFKAAGVDLASTFMDIAASVDTIAISNATASSFTTGVAATAQYQLQSDGDIATTNGTNTVTDVGDWISPKTNMSLYSARATLVSGSITSGTMGTWLNLASTRTWSTQSATVPSGFQEGVFTLEIRLDSSGTVLDTATITLQAERSA